MTKLHFLVDERGMNLTKALLATMIKYPGSSLEIERSKEVLKTDIRHKKMGYFYADRENFEDIENSCGLGGNRHPLTFLLEAADDIAYNTADIEDAIKKGNISYNELIEELNALASTYKSEPDACEEAISCFESMVGKLNVYHTRALENSYENPGLYAIQNWIVRVQGILITCATDAFMDNYDAIMDGSFGFDLLGSSNGKYIIGDI